MKLDKDYLNSFSYDALLFAYSSIFGIDLGAYSKEDIIGYILSQKVSYKKFSSAIDKYEEPYLG